MTKKYVPMGVFLKKLTKQTNNSKYEDQMAIQIKQVGLPIPERQYKWHPDRKFSADFAYPAIKLLIEIDGAIWVKGGHSSGTGITRDRIKDAEALIQGWKVLRVTSDMVKDGTAIGYLEQIFKGFK